MRQPNALAAGGAPRAGRAAGPHHQVLASHLAALVAMATHGQTGFGWVLPGSVAEDVLRHGAQPLLLLRPAVLPAAEVTPDGSSAAGAAEGAATTRDAWVEG